MPEFKLVINDVKTGKSYQKAIAGEESDIFKKTKIGSIISGDSIGFSGYEFEIRGGSDNCGFPMRSDIEGINRKRPLVTNSIGVHIKGKGIKKRKTLVGNTLSKSISQINLKTTKYGSKSITEILGIVEKKEEVKVEQAPQTT
ncbi:30S ribosomal protein S6e [Candidatus Woesearchaeota archaeon]|nr:30S ribosomal protein S6e [Candidatus Woesearchaeota archaeon]